MQTFTLPTELVQAIGNYLSTRPHYEVDGLISALRRIVEEQQPKPE